MENQQLEINNMIKIRTKAYVVKSSNISGILDLKNLSSFLILIIYPSPSLSYSSIIILFS